MVKMDEIYGKIREIVGEERVTNDKFEKIMYTHDLAPLPKLALLGFKMEPDIVVRPRTAEEVSKVVKLAREHKIPVVPRGSSSWGFGGAVPNKGGIMFDMTEMKDIIGIDEENMSVTVGPGITWKKLYEKMLRKGYLIGAYPSSAPTATIGGWLSTGGIGIGSYKYGSARDLVRNIEVVLPNGEIIQTSKDSLDIGASGENLKYLFIGAEGTLGVITKVTFNLVPAFEELRPLSYSFLDMEKACAAVQAITKENIMPYHVGILDKNYFEFLRALNKGGHIYNGMVNIALEGDKATVDYQEKKLDELMARFDGKQEDKKAAKHEWDERSYELRVKRLATGALMSEVMVPMNRMYDLVKEIYNLEKKLRMNIAITALPVDRNTVVFLPIYLTDERDLMKSMTSMGFMQAIGDASAKLGGRSMGLGLFRAPTLKNMHDKNAVQIIKNIKKELDPDDIMNPGKLVRLETRYGMAVPGVLMDFGLGMLAGVKGALKPDKYDEGIIP